MTDKPTGAELTKFAAKLIDDIAEGEPTQFRFSTHTTIVRRRIDSYGECTTFDPLTDRNDDALVQEAMAKRRDDGEDQLWFAFQTELIMLCKPRLPWTLGLSVGYYVCGDNTRAAWAAKEAMKATRGVPG